MTQNAGSEKELVLGNKQLISVFFVGVLLCGVFFVLGYMVGRGASKTSLPAAEASGSATSSQPQEPPHEVAASPSDSAASSPEQPPPVSTKPARDLTSDPAPAATEPPHEAATEPGGRITVSTPEEGATYLQVTALPRPDADNTIRTLREQSFPTILAASSKDGLFRVLVGPYHQTGQLADAKARLKTLGFANAFVQRQ